MDARVALGEEGGRHEKELKMKIRIVKDRLKDRMVERHDRYECDYFICFMPRSHIYSFLMTQVKTCNSWQFL